MEKSAQKPKIAEEPFGGCESCVFFDEGDEEVGEGCSLNLDEDEYAAYVITAGGRSSHRCPYYRLHDEYKTVRKQN